MSQPGSGPAEGDAEARRPRHLWDYWRIAWEGRWVLGASLGVTLFVALVGTLLLPDRYRAEALVTINLAPAPVLGSEVERGLNRANFIEQDRAFKTEFVKIRTREMLGRAMEQHDLGSKVPGLDRATDAIGILQRVTKIELMPQTNVAKLSATWTDPAVAAAIANAIAESYVASEIEERIAMLRQRADRLRISAEEKGVARQAQIEYELSVIDAADFDVEAVAALPVFEGNESLSELREQQGMVERELESLRRLYGWNHEEVRGKVAEKGEIERQMRDLVGAVRQTLEKELQALGGDVDRPRSPGASLPSTTKEADLKFEHQLRERMAEQLILASLAEPKASVIDPALPPEKPYAPRLGLNLALAMVVGLGFGGGLIFFRDYLDVSVKTLEDVERDLGLNLLAVVPRMEGEPSPVAREAFQTLRTGLLFASAGRRDRVLLVTAAAPREGKSTVVLNLAKAIAGSGESVVVVDGDMRKPSLARLFQVSSSRGLSNYLADPTEKDWRRFVLPAGEKLSVLPTGPVPPNPLDLLGLARFRELVHELEKHHDWVIVDSPPVSSVSDSVVLATVAGLVLLVIRHDQTDKEVIRRALARLRGVGAKITGAVLNDVDMSKSYNRDYYYGRYYYGQSYGGTDGADVEVAGGRARRLLRRLGSK